MYKVCNMHNTHNNLKKLLGYCKQCLNAQFGTASIQSDSSKYGDKVMKAWQTHNYGGIDSIKLSPSAVTPVIRHPNDVLIKVRAASLNQIDRRMAEGYGRTVVNTLKRIDSVQHECGDYDKFPLTLGRDCSGVVEAIGGNVKHISPGTSVYAAIPVERQGCHAEFVVTPSSSLAIKPPTLSHIEAASIPYAALTAYTAIRKVGGLSARSPREYNSLVIGASGGVGLYAIQLLRSIPGVTVTATCNHDAVDLLYNTGAHEVIDYSKGDIWEQLRSSANNQFEFILDLVGEQSNRAVEVLKPWSCSKYVTVVSPLLGHTDTYGLAGGLMRSTIAAAYDTLYGLQVGSSYRWAFFMPDGNVLLEINDLITKGKFKPVIERVYKFNDVILAFERLKMKHLRGKLVIDICEGE